jgi:hypothetical protein
MAAEVGEPKVQLQEADQRTRGLGIAKPPFLEYLGVGNMNCGASVSLASSASFPVTKYVTQHWNQLPRPQDPHQDLRGYSSPATASGGALKTASF